MKGGSHYHDQPFTFKPGRWSLWLHHCWMAVVAHGGGNPWLHPISHWQWCDFADTLLSLTWEGGIPGQTDPSASISEWRRHRSRACVGQQRCMVQWNNVVSSAGLLWLHWIEREGADIPEPQCKYIYETPESGLLTKEQMTCQTYCHTHKKSCWVT